MDEFEDVLKKLNKYDRTNVFSKIWFCWMCPYFVKGWKKEVDEDDIYRHRRKHGSELLGNKLDAAWKCEIKNNKKPSLLRVLVKLFLGEVCLIYILICIAESLRMLQPMLMSRLLSYYDNNATEGNKNEAYMYAVLIVSVLFISVPCLHFFQMNVLQVGLKLRIACCALIYRKALKLNKAALGEVTIGQMINLLSNDVSRFDSCLQELHHLWVGPLETVIVMYLTYYYMGYSALAGPLFLLCFVPFQSYLGKLISKFRLRIALRTDQRVRLMNEVITGIQVIKMYTWEAAFAKAVDLARGKEMKSIRSASYIRAINVSCALILNRVAIYLCILAYVLTGNVLTSSYVYTMTTYFRLLNSVSMFFPRAVTTAFEVYVSIKRIQNFLLYEEIEPRAVEAPKITDDEKSCIGIYLKDVSVRWRNDSSDYTLENITIEAVPRRLTVIVGSVGSGKTTLLHVILRELYPVEGTANIVGAVSYASQEPWLFGASVRQNILFGQKFNKAKYDEVIRVCALERDFELLSHGDHTLIGERGVSLSGGQRARINLARAVYKEADIYLLDDPLSAVDTHVGKHLFEKCICGYLGSKCVILVTHQLQYLKNANSIYMLEDGKIKASGSYTDVKSSGKVFSRLVSQIEDEEEVRRKSVAPKEKKEHEVQVLEKESKATGNVPLSVYRDFAKAGGGFLKVLILILGFVLSQSSDSIAEYYVTWWVNIEQVRSSNTSAPTEATVNVSQSDAKITADDPYANWWLISLYTSDEGALTYYTLICMAVVVLCLARSLYFFNWCLTVSTRLHKSMMDNIVYSSMLFFSKNPSGRILNRFSKDIGSLDELLPFTLLDTVQIGLRVLAISIVIGSLSYWIIIPSIVILVIFYLLRTVYLQTSTAVKRIESITRSPVFTHLSTSLQGLTTIRALKAEDALTKEFDNYQNRNSAAYFMFIGASRTFGFWLDAICVIYVGVAIIILLFVKSESFGGNIGLALTQAMGITGMFQWGMRQWSELENQMTSVERVQEYAALKQEADEGKYQPPENWPDKGKIEFDKMSLQYTPEEPFVLKKVTFVIQPKEKVGIVGRTGAGKSSLIQALFRLAHIEGSILIDNVNTKTVPLKRLRSSISIIPQEPVLFSGTFRRNLDPFDEYKDEALWNALEEVELKSMVAELPSGLNHPVTEGGGNLSVGQRQLVCLARAILRNNKILVMDEATSNVDPQTDALIQKTIRKTFHDCTVLTIAHRLHTVMDSDKILVMDAGRSVEFDHPHLLLQDEESIFYSLVRQTGKTTAEALQKIAEENYKNRQDAD
ncbi:unnamed protein product [Callosobruchus maculatus]|uniref:Multidrug resistance-associated protein lethal(2)03659 n=1 Tax=Callosobruchus maculatus TaxID=64391 RepID=A0A653DMQ3_CALMS|nr:unnamed protein product [Callosobruchus maculatus]